MHWETTIEEQKKIKQICNRIQKKIHNPVDIAFLQMDIEATHCNGCPLDFDKLLKFDGFNFYHDIIGIRKHLDRQTGKLQNCFLPKCAKRSEER